VVRQHGSKAVTGRGDWFKWLIAAIFLTSIVINLSRPMVSYRALELGIAPHLLGIIAACYALAPLVITVHIGRLLDRNNARWIQITGALLFVAGAVGLCVTDSLLGLALYSGLLGIGQMIVVVSLQTAIAVESSGGALDSRYGRYSLAASSGQFVGPLIGAAIASLLHDASATPALIASAGIAVLGLIAVIAVRPPTVTPPSGEREHVPWPRPRELLGGGAGRVLIVSFASTAVVDTITIYLPALGEQRNWSIEAVSVLLAVRGIASMASRVALGRMVAMVGRKRLLVVGTLVSAASLAVVGLVPNLAIVFVAVAVTGYALGLCGPLTMAWLASDTRDGTRGTVMSVRLATNRLGQIVVPAVAGLLASSGGAAAVLYLAGAGLGLSAAALRGAHPRADPNDASNPA
jgi:MFS family permease